MARSDLAKIKVFSNNVRLVRITKDMKVAPNGQPMTSLVRVGDGTEYELFFTVELKPLEIATFLVMEGPPNEEGVFTKEELFTPAAVNTLNESGLFMHIGFNTLLNQTTMIRFECVDGSFENMTMTENVVFYGGSLTHSCVYLFNPIGNSTVVEDGLLFVNATKLKTHAFT